MSIGSEREIRQRFDFVIAEAPSEAQTVGFFFAEFNPDSQSSRICRKLGEDGGRFAARLA